MLWRCDFTKNPCGTDTQMVGLSCGCQPCCMSRQINRLQELAYAPDGKEHRRVVFEQAAEIDRLRAERMKLDRRIHNQRRSNRETWEIVEMRRKWLGSDTARNAYVRLLKRYRELRGQPI